MIKLLFVEAHASIFLGEDKRVVEEALLFYQHEAGAKLINEVRADRLQALEWGVDFHTLMHAVLDFGGPNAKVHVMSGYTAPHGAIRFDFKNTPEEKKRMKALYSALSKGGQILVPLGRVYWGATYAHFIDQYEITWMLNMND